MKKHPQLPIHPNKTNLRPSLVSHPSNQQRFSSVTTPNIQLTQSIGTHLNQSQRLTKIPSSVTTSTVRSLKNIHQGSILPPYQNYPATHTHANLTTSVFKKPQVYTTPTLTVVSDKQLPVVGSYVSNQPKRIGPIHEINPDHHQQQIGTKVVQASLKDIIPTEIIKINSENIRNQGLTQSQCDQFGSSHSINNLSSSNSISRFNNIYESGVGGSKTTSILGENIKVSVYRSPDVIVKQPELITEGPKLQKQHVLTVGVEGKLLPTFVNRPKQQQVRQRSMINKQQTVYVHEPRFAPDIVVHTGGQQVFTNTYEIKPSVTQVVAPTITTFLGQGQQINALSSAPTYTPVTNLANNPYASYQRQSQFRRAEIPLKDLQTSQKKFGEESVIHKLNHNIRAQTYELSSTNTNTFDYTPSYALNNTSSTGLQYQQKHIETKGQQVGGKVTQGKITQPLSFSAGSTKPRIVQNSIGQIGHRPEGMYEGPPKSNDPQKLKLD